MLILSVRNRREAGSFALVLSIENHVKEWRVTSYSSFVDCRTFGKERLNNIKAAVLAGCM